MNACCGLILPSAISTKSESETVIVVSTLPVAGPSFTSACFKSSAEIAKKIIDEQIFLFYDDTVTLWHLKFHTNTHSASSF